MEESSSQAPKTLTPKEVDALLPEVKELVQQLQGIQQSIIKTNQQLDDTAHKLSEGNGYPLPTLKDELEDLTKHQLQLLEAFQSVMDRLEEVGAHLKDLKVGLVDFYCVRNGELVFLCWKMDEESVQFWHTLEGGFGGRQPLDSL